MSTDMRAETIDRAAHRLAAARIGHQPCPPVRDLLPPGDVDAAYAVQAAMVADRVLRGAKLVGRKIGLTNPAVQAQLGVDSPDFGALLDDMAVPDGGTADARRLLQPRIETEVAFVLGGWLGAGATPADVRAATAGVVPALEIVDSRIAGWDITIVDTVADNASSGMFVLGENVRPLDDLDLRPLAMTMWRDDEPVSRGTGAACLGDPVRAVAWLADELARRGDPLGPGDVVLAGALGPMVDVYPGELYRAEIERLGTVSVGFS